MMYIIKLWNYKGLKQKMYFRVLYQHVRYSFMPFNSFVFFHACTIFLWIMNPQIILKFHCFKLSLFQVEDEILKKENGG